MKISKLIFISLLTVIALIILSSALYVRLTGHHKDDLSGMSIRNYKLPEIKVLCISNCKRIDLSSSDSSSIKATWPKDSIFTNEFYTVKGDTLTLSDARQLADIEIKVNKRVSVIYLKKANIRVSSIASSRIGINMDKSNLYFDLDSTIKPLSIKINAKNHSQINSNLIKIDSLAVVLIKSHLHYGLYAKSLDISLADSSSLVTKQPERLTLKRDTTCSFYSY